MQRYHNNPEATAAALDSEVCSNNLVIIIVMIRVPHRRITLLALSENL